MKIEVLCERPCTTNRSGIADVVARYPQWSGNNAGVNNRWFLRDDKGLIYLEIEALTELMIKVAVELMALVCVAAVLVPPQIIHITGRDEGILDRMIYGCRRRDLSTPTGQGMAFSAAARRREVFGERQIVVVVKSTQLG